MISRKGLLKFARKHPETMKILLSWHRVARKADWNGLHEVRQDFPSADQVGGALIFDILGGSYRLIAAPVYKRRRIYLKALLTHREYDRKEWMKWA